MEKAAEVYNKLKLRFVGKGEVAAKPKTEHKEPGDNEETQNTGKHPSLRPLWGFWAISTFCVSSHRLHFSRLHSSKRGLRPEKGRHGGGRETKVTRPGGE